MLPGGEPATEGALSSSSSENGEPPAATQTASILRKRTRSQRDMQRDRLRRTNKVWDNILCNYPGKSHRPGGKGARQVAARNLAIIAEHALHARDISLASAALAVLLTHTEHITPVVGQLGVEILRLAPDSNRKRQNLIQYLKFWSRWDAINRKLVVAELAVELTRQGDHGDACQRLEQFVKKEPDNAMARGRLGLAQLEKLHTLDWSTPVAKSLAQSAQVNLDHACDGLPSASRFAAGRAKLLQLKGEHRAAADTLAKCTENGTPCAALATMRLRLAQNSSRPPPPEQIVPAAHSLLDIDCRSILGWKALDECGLVEEIAGNVGRRLQHMSKNFHLSSECVEIRPRALESWSRLFKSLKILLSMNGGKRLVKVWWQARHDWWVDSCLKAPLGGDPMEKDKLMKLRRNFAREVLKLCKEVGRQGLAAYLGQREGGGILVLQT